MTHLRGAQLNKCSFIIIDPGTSGGWLFPFLGVSSASLSTPRPQMGPGGARCPWLDAYARAVGEGPG